MKLVSMVCALLLVASTAFAAENSLTGQWTATSFPTGEEGTVEFSQVPGTCDGGTFVSAITSQLGLGTCVTTSTFIDSRAADEYGVLGSVSGANWWGTYFNVVPGQCDPVNPLGAAFNLFFFLGGTTCPDEANLLLTIAGHVPGNITFIGPNYEHFYEASFDGSSLPAATPVFFSLQQLSDSFPQWGWTESADNQVGARPCLEAVSFGFPDYVPIESLVAPPWCGQAFEIATGEPPVPTFETSWGKIKSTFAN